MAEATTKPSLLSPEKIQAGSDAKLSVEISNGLGLMMRVIVKRERKSDFVAYVDFFTNNGKTKEDASNINIDVLSDLIGKYKTHVTKLTRQDHVNATKRNGSMYHYDSSNKRGSG